MPNQNNTQWDAAKETRLRELHANGDSFGVIAADLGMTRSMVAGKCKRLGLTFAPRQERRCMTPPATKIKRQVVALAPPVEPLRLLFADLRTGKCRWIEDDRTFCGHYTEGSYCAYHSQLVYRRAA